MQLAQETLLETPAVRALVRAAVAAERGRCLAAFRAACPIRGPFYEDILAAIRSGPADPFADPRPVVGECHP